MIAYRRGGEQLTDNWLTRMITEYMPPGLDRLPITLGGTSSHFRTAGCGHSGAGTRSNVTEETDLGVRAAALGHTVGVINSTTFEEANRAPGNLVRRRSRWITATRRRCSCTSGTRFPSSDRRGCARRPLRAAHRRCAADGSLHAAASRALRRVVGAAARVISVVASMFAVRVGLRHTAVTGYALFTLVALMSIPRKTGCGTGYALAAVGCLRGCGRRRARGSRSGSPQFWGDPARDDGAQHGPDHQQHAEHR